MKHLFLLLLTVLYATGISAQCYNLVWADEFDGTSLDNSKWSYQVGAGGWGNNELQHYTDRIDNTTVSNGALQIIAKEEAYNGASYTSSRIRSINQGDWTYGRMEASIKLPVGQGIWPAFWMMPTESAYGIWPRSGEIDIMEYLGHQTSINYGTCHFGDAWDNKDYSGNSRNISPASYADGNFHTFSVEWEPNEIRWYVDGIHYHTFDGNVGSYIYPFDRDFHFILNIAVGGSWPGNPDATTVFPQTMEVDYVRVYQELPDVKMDGAVTQLAGATGTSYSAPDIPGTTYTWTVPSGAAITSGAGTNEVSIDWGYISGDVVVELSNACGSTMLSTSVVLTANQTPNPSFENNLDNWYPDVFGSAWTNWNISVTDTYVGNKAMCAEVISLGANIWDIQLSPETVSLEAGENYTISFWAKADASNKEISIAIIHPTNYSYYGGTVFTLTDTWAEYTYSFNSPATSGGSINIQFGHELGTFCLDEYSFAKTSDLPIAAVDFNLKVMLEGPYDSNTALMKDDLRTDSYIPSSEPFTNLGFASVNNLVSESIVNPSSVFAITGNDAIVDWIFIELRSNVEPTVVVATRAALLQRDGDVVDMDGVSPLSFANVYADDYYVAIRHRNHLSIQTQNTVSLNALTSITLDFSDSSTAIEGVNPQKNVDGTMVLWAGDATSDNSVNASDRSETWNLRNQSSYLSADLNLDGSCDAADRSISWNNRNKEGY